jgi:pimeloyl-ACP methyl ester carboxylesterase
VAASERRPEGYRQCQLTAQDGLRLAYRDYGEVLAPGPALLCLSGLTSQSGDFHHLASRLAHDGARHGSLGCRVLALDYRGRGRSAYDRNWRNYRPEVYVGDILDLAAATNISCLVVVGTSLGGLLAMALACVRPTLLAGVILNDVGPEFAGDGFERIADHVGTPAPQADWQAAVSYLRHLFSPAYPGLDEAAWLEMAHNTFQPGDDGRLHLDYDLELAKALKAAPPPGGIFGRCSARYATFPRWPSGAPCPIFSARPPSSAWRRKNQTSNASPWPTAATRRCLTKWNAWPPSMPSWPVGLD